MPSVTVYVDLNGIPHTFIGLTDANGITTYFGCAPSGGRYAGAPTLNPDGTVNTNGDGSGWPIAPGTVRQGINPVIRDSAGHIERVAWSKTIDITAERFAEIHVETMRN